MTAREWVSMVVAAAVVLDVAAAAAVFVLAALGMVGS